jgi:hypothetical protein
MSISVGSQSQQIVHQTLAQKKNKNKKESLKRAGRVAQGMGPEFKPQYLKNKNKNKTKQKNKS